MGDMARGGASNRFIEEFGKEIEEAQGTADGSTVGMNNDNQVVYVLQTSMREYVSDNVIYEPDAADEDNLESLMVSLLIEEGDKDFGAKRTKLIKRMKKIDLIQFDFPEDD